MKISWKIEPAISGDQLLLEWAEQNGPSVTESAKQGFGSTLIERALSHDLNGNARIEFRAEGVRATVRAPLRKRQAI